MHALDPGEHAHFLAARRFRVGVRRIVGHVRVGRDDVGYDGAVDGEREHVERVVGRRWVIEDIEAVRIVLLAAESDQIAVRQVRQHEFARGFHVRSIASGGSEYHGGGEGRGIHHGISALVPISTVVSRPCGAAPRAVIKEAGKT